MSKRELTMKLKKSKGAQESIKKSDTIGQASAAQSPDPDPTLQIATPKGITDLVTIVTATVTTVLVTVNETIVDAAMLKAPRVAVDATTGTIVIAPTKIVLGLQIVATVTLTPLEMESLPSM
jgi:hypothetical protein